MQKGNKCPNLSAIRKAEVLEAWLGHLLVHNYVGVETPLAMILITLGRAVLKGGVMG